MIAVACGARDWSDALAIRRELAALRAGLMPGERLVVMQGGAPGADALARRECALLGVECRQVDADWDRFGAGAGPIRNSVMAGALAEAASRGERAVVLAFHKCLRKSGGTRDMVMRANEAGVPVRLFAG